jgi:Mrp family chromosome partitioning ATPase/capsular polysaccharide biosynthesis protein
MSGGSADPGNLRMASSPPAPSVDGDEPSLVMSILRRKKRIVFVTTAVAVLATVAATASQTKIYESTSAAEVQAPPGQTASAGPNMATEAQIARSPAVARAVASDLRAVASDLGLDVSPWPMDVSPSQLLSRLSIDVPADSDVVNFTYASPRPEAAQAGAQAFASAYADVRRMQFEDDRLASASSTSEQIHSMTNQLTTLSREFERAQGATKTVLGNQRDGLTLEIALLQQKLANLNDQIASFSPVRVLGSAPLPRSPARPNLPLNVLLGLLGGLLLGFAIAALAEYRDDRVRSATDLHARLAAPVLGVIPKNDHEAHGVEPTLVASDAPASLSGNAFRRLSTNFVAAASHAGTRSVAVTSVDHNDSPTALIANLAAVLAATGKRVVLLSMTQRRPTLEEVFGAPPGPGFLDALDGAIPLQHALAETGIENLLLCRRGLADVIEIGMASVPEDRPRGVAVSSKGPAHSLGSERTAQLIADLAAPVDFVLVDAPALLRDADAAALARACDGVLAVATPTTTRADIARSREQFERVRATLLGSVFIEVRGPPVSSSRSAARKRENVADLSDQPAQLKKGWSSW